MSDEVPSKPNAAGLPPWLATFADLMSLLMCFFVLLLSFSQMDLSKFKRVAGSMEKAFGVQREIVAYEIPKGTSIIAEEFSPGKPDPTPLNEITQKTIDDFRVTLEFDEKRTSGASKDKNSKKEQPDTPEEDADKEKAAQEQAEAIAGALAQEILAGEVEVEAFGQRVIIRILEQGSFESGLARLKPQFEPVLKKLDSILNKVKGDIIVAGHTDNIPIYNSQFQSNWALSAQRAVAVAHALLALGNIDKKRLSVEGFADTKPLLPNTSAENREKNRRVEIIIVQGDNPDFRTIDQVETDNYKPGDLLKPKRRTYDKQNIDANPQKTKEDFSVDFEKYRTMEAPQLKSWQDYQEQPLKFNSRKEP